MAVHELDQGGLIRSTQESGRWRYWLAPAMAAVDLASIWFVVFAASFAYHSLATGGFGNYAITSELAGLLSVVFLFANLSQGRYRIANYLSSDGQLIQAFNVWNAAMVAFIAIAFLAKLIDEYSRAVVLITYAAGTPAITLARNLLTQVISRASRSGRVATERVLIVGREADVLGFVSRYRPWNVGFVVVDAIFLRTAEASASAEEREAMLAEDLASARQRARRLQPDSVFIATPLSERQLIDRCVNAFLTVPVSIHLTPEAILDRFRNPRIARVGSLMSLQLTRPPLSILEIVLKRAFDLAGASLALILLTPVFAAIALAIRLEGPGPIIFAQRRYGFNQRQFRIFKFRTMIVAEDGPKVVQARPNDPRITRVGAFLRRYNLDELPQLANVLIGQMSLVGPRPHALAHDHEFEEKIALYARRHNVKPGITGWAQVNGFRGLTDSDDKMARRVEHDLWYIDNWSLWLDLVILVRTILSPKAFRNAH